MEEEYFKDLAKLIESGEYYDDAREWYKRKYLRDIIDRSYFLMYSLIAITMIIVFFVTMFSYYPLKPTSPVLIGVGDQTQQFTALRSIGNRSNREENPHPEIHKYMLSEFIQSYESYDFNNDFALLKRNETLLGQLSSEEVLSEYRVYMSTTNPNSPMLQLAKNAVLKVSVIPETFVITKEAGAGISFNAEERYTASVTYTVDEISRVGVTRKVMTATIDYSYVPVYYNKQIKDFSPFKLTVIRYERKLVE